MLKTPVTRIAPSPTGFMHIGTARTALFNWLYARGRSGKFLLRIEDTDRARSTKEATDAIIEGMTWLGLNWDGPVISQHENAARHAQIAHELLALGAAYKCFSSPEEIAQFREAARSEGRSTLFHSPWRDADPSTYPDTDFVIRIKAPREGHVVIQDQVQGDIKIQANALDDMILLRSDGSPTYMLAVVVDDYDMGVNCVIRGDDHLNNTARQNLIYDAMGWSIPTYAHIPLIHGEDGKKLSKRHGALGVMEYRAMGIPAVALRNYLARLGWSHGDAELFTDKEALDWFDIRGIGKAPARLDMKKLNHISGQHIARMENDKLFSEICDFMTFSGTKMPDQQAKDKLRRAIGFLKSNAKNYVDLIEKARFCLVELPFERDEKSRKALDEPACRMLAELTLHLQNASWVRDDLEGSISQFAQDRGQGLGKIAQPLRAALVGRMATPSVFDIMEILGPDESIARISDAIG